MRLSRSVVYGMFAVLFLVGCKKNTPSEECEEFVASNVPNKIMPFGASRVEGSYRNGAYESYRYELWKLLMDKGVPFDFMGSFCDLGDYPTYNGEAFDVNHQGTGGITSTDLLSGVNGWLDAVGIPDVVLFSSPGGNDALNGEPFGIAEENVRAIIQRFQTANPNVTIVIEQMAPAESSSMTPELSQFMDQMNAAVAQMTLDLSTQNSQIIVVDMLTGFQDSFLADEVHYNNSGAVFVANNYFEVLDTILH